jgi:hypothetical protein
MLCGQRGKGFAGEVEGVSGNAGEYRGTDRHPLNVAGSPRNRTQLRRRGLSGTCRQGALPPQLLLEAEPTIQMLDPASGNCWKHRCPPVCATNRAFPSADHGWWHGAIIMGYGHAPMIAETAKNKHYTRAQPSIE